MSRIGFALSMVAIVAVAAWAYHVNYRTAEALREVRALEREIAAERERLQVLAVEWAHLNRPERLKRLVAEHNDALLLMPLSPEHFGEAAEVPFPPRSEPRPGTGSLKESAGPPVPTAAWSSP